MPDHLPDCVPERVPDRPVLSPALPRLWRTDGSLQLGRTPGEARVLPGAARVRAVLALLDGALSWQQVERAHPDAGPVLEALHAAGLLLDAQDLLPTGLPRADADRLAPDLACLTLVHGAGSRSALRARTEARVVVHGAGRVGGPLASLLQGAGVGTVDLRDHGPTRPADLAVGGAGAAQLGRPRAEAVQAQWQTGGVVEASERATLVVLTDEGACATAAVLTRVGVPHLLAGVEERTGTVGPLVLPGESACLTCLDLTRAGLDPGWAGLSVVADGPSPACDGVLAAAVAAQAALQVLQLLEGGIPGSVGGTLELTLPGWAWRRRSWPQHPGCACAWGAKAQAA